MGKSAEPSVFGFIRRTGLAGAGHAVVESETSAGAPSFFHYALQYTDHFSGCILVIDLGASGIIGIDLFILVIHDPGDAGWRTVFSVIFQRAVSGRHFHRLHAIGEAAQRRSEHFIRIYDLGKMHSFELGKAELRGNVLIDLPRHCIQRSLHRFLELEFSHVGVVEVLGTVFDLLIVYDRSRIIPFFKGRRIYDQRLDRTAGLSVALESAVQRQARVDILGSSADHCDDLACFVVDTDRRALHFILAVIRRIGEFR